MSAVILQGLWLVAWASSPGLDVINLTQCILIFLSVNFFSLKSGWWWGKLWLGVTLWWHLGCTLEEWSITTVDGGHVRKWLKVGTSVHGITIILVVKLWLIDGTYPWLDSSGCSFFFMAVKNRHPLPGCIVAGVKTFALLSALPRAFLYCFFSWILLFSGLSDASEMQSTEVPGRILLPSAPVVPIGMGISCRGLSL